MADQALVRFERDGRIGVITIDRPHVRNAINGEVARGIEAAIDDIENDPSLWIGILAANGPVFSAGADLKAAVDGCGGQISTARGGFGGIAARQREKPIIAASMARRLRAAARSCWPVTWWWPRAPRGSAFRRSSAG